MRYLFSVALTLLAVLTFSTAYAADQAPGDDAARAKPLAKAQSAVVSQLLQVRFAVGSDAVTGASRLRIVFDLSGPAEAQGAIVAAPTPRLVLGLKGANPGAVGGSIDLDGVIADSASISSPDGVNSQIVVLLPLMVEDGDYKVFTLPGGGGKPFRVVVDINRPAPPPEFHFTAGLQSKLIVLDPGHGGTDPGAIGPGKVQEKAVTLAVAQQVKTLLEKAGATVLMTRQGDSDVYGPNASAVDELSARTSAANSRKADIFLSIHANSFINPAVGGTGTYYYQKTKYDALLAQCVQAGLAEAGGLQDRGFFPARFYVVRRTVMPATLAELAFLSNPAEEKLLNDPLFQQKMAQGIVRGLDNFFAQAARIGG